MTFPRPIAACLAALAMLLEASCNGRAPWSSSPHAEASSGPRPTRTAARDTPRPPTAPAFRLVTFNTGLAQGAVKYVAERARGIADALVESDADVVCLQEVWLESDYARLRERTRARFPFADRPPLRAARTPGGCSEREALPVLSCAKRNCAVPSEQLGSCMALRCGYLAARLSLPCAECLLEDPNRTFADAADECRRRGATATPSKRDATTAEGVFVYGGSSGLVLLGRERPIATDFLPLPSMLVARGVIYARFGRTGQPPLHVFCTHLATDLPATPAPDAPSWSTQQRREIDTLLDWVDGIDAHREPVAILGDFNAGPSVAGKLEARLADNYARFSLHGFSDPFAESAGVQCSWCNDNLLHGGASHGGTLIDHALLRNAGTVARAVRIFDDPLEIDLAGKRIRTAYSDHYGIEVVLDAGG